MKTSLSESTIRVETTGLTVIQVIGVDSDHDIQVEPENDGKALIKNPKIVGVMLLILLYLSFA